jgi:hypothetical protein
MHRSLETRVRARLFGRSIDDRLLAGISPYEDGALAARRELLVGVRYRTRVAAALRRMVDRARRPQPFQPAIPVRSKEVLETEDEILSLADELEHIPDANPRGVILASLLLTDGTSPVYWHKAQLALDVAVKHAHSALLLG